jgi:hypothetical protein
LPKDAPELCGGFAENLHMGWWAGRDSLAKLSLLSNLFA